MGAWGEKAFQNERRGSGPVGRVSARGDGCSVGAAAARDDVGEAPQPDFGFDVFDAAVCAPRERVGQRHVDDLTKALQRRAVELGRSARVRVNRDVKVEEALRNASCPVSW